MKKVKWLPVVMAAMLFATSLAGTAFSKETSALELREVVEEEKEATEEAVEEVAEEAEEVTEEAAEEVAKEATEEVAEEVAEEAATEEVAEAEEEEEEEKVGSVQYVIYLGTNDKDDNTPVFTEAEAIEKAREILIEHFGGYTIQEAHGGWIDEGKIYQEYTLVIYLSDTTLEEVHAAADDMVETFHQSSVMIQANPTTTEFYSGAGA